MVRQTVVGYSVGFGVFLCMILVCGKCSTNCYNFIFNLGVKVSDCHCSDWFLQGSARLVLRMNAYKIRNKLFLMQICCIIFYLFLFEMLDVLLLISYYFNEILKNGNFPKWLIVIYINIVTILQIKHCNVILSTELFSHSKKVIH